MKRYAFELVHGLLELGREKRFFEAPGVLLPFGQELLQALQKSFVFQNRPLDELVADHFVEVRRWRLKRETYFPPGSS